MAKNSGKLDSVGERKASKSKAKLDDDLDALFRLPLAEFTAARNTLAGQLKKSGSANEAEFVKSLGKPSVTAWAVNQLYWNHRNAFDRLMATGERFRQVQTSRTARKIADMREALDARREELLNLSDFATALLRNAGHNPSPDTIHRITTTLEAMSAYASQPDGPRPGRLTQDVDPPGFESLDSFVPSLGTRVVKEEAPRVTSSRKSDGATKSISREPEPAVDVRKTKQASIAAAKASLQEAKSLLIEARATAQRLEAAQKKANTDAKEAQKQRREAEARFEEARAESEAAAQHAQSIAAEVKQAAKALEDAKRTVEKASRELELLFRS